MNTVSRQAVSRGFKFSAVSAAIIGAVVAVAAPAANAAVSVRGVVAGSYYVPPVNSNNPALSTASSTSASVYAGAVVCFDVQGTGTCVGQPSTTTNSVGAFLLSSRTVAPLIAEIPVTATNGGNAVAQRLVLTATVDQINASAGRPGAAINVAVTPLTSEVAQMMAADSGSYSTELTKLAGRLGVTNAEVVSDPNTVAAPDQTAVLRESVVATSRLGLAAKMVDRGDISPAALAANATATTPIALPEAVQVAMNGIEGIPRYDHLFVIMLENKATSAIKGSPYAPNINKFLSEANQFTSYFATGNPSEPNYTALGGADDWGITDDNQWNCGATGANAVQDLPVPSNNQPGLAASPTTATCAQATNHNIVGRPNMFNALTTAGLTWRTYSQSMNPGQDFRSDSVADPAVKAADNVYPLGTIPGETAQVGDANLVLPMPAQLYRTKHHPGMAYQNVRSAAEFKNSNRTLGGGQWDANLLNASKYAIPAGYNIDQFGADLQSGDIGNLNFVIPDQCNDMHGITVTGTDSVTGKSVTASDCSSVSNNVANTSPAPIIVRGDNATNALIEKIEASPIWQNTNKRVAIVVMFDEGNATAGFNSCCGWNPVQTATDNPLKQNADGTFSVDTSITNYYQGNHGHGESVFGVLSNQPTAPVGIVDSDYYSHFSFVRTMQDMFALADPGVPGSYMNRSKYTQSFITANILNLPIYASAADPHFNAVRPMNHQYVIPAGYTELQSSDVNTAPQVGPDATQVNVWAQK